MSTIRENVDAFAFFLEGRTTRPSDDIVLPRKLSYYYLNQYKNLIVEEDKLQTLYNSVESMLMTLPCVEMEEVSDTSHCPCAPADNCSYMQSVQDLPSFVGGLPISVTSVSGKVIFDFVPLSEFSYKINGRTKASSQSPYYFLRTIGDKTKLMTHVNSEKRPKALTVRGIPSDPLDFAGFVSCGESPDKFLCDPMDIEMPIEPSIEAKIFERTYNTMRAMKMFERSGDVFTNDADETEPSAPPIQL